MGLIKNDCIEFAETIYPHNPHAQEQLNQHITDKPGPTTITPLTIETFRTHWETHHQIPHNFNYQTMHQLLNQPDKVCHCGTTSTGTCPRCGQTPNP